MRSTKVFKDTKRIILAGFLFLSFLVPLCSENNVQTYDEIQSFLKTIPQNYQNVLDADLDSATDEELFDYFIDISNCSNRKDELRQYYSAKIAKIDSSVKEKFVGIQDFSALDDDTTYKLADFLNQQMHLNFLQKYNKSCFTIDEIADGGLFDCVSATILYGILLTRYNVSFSIVETPDHVFLKIYLPESKKEIDVETTNYYGFDPGTKTEFKSNFGMTTGFTYVSPVNYKRRNTISLKHLYSLVLQNSVSIHTSKKRYLEASHEASILLAFRDDEKSRSSYDATVNNLTSLFVYDNNVIGNYEQSYIWIENYPGEQNRRAFLNNTYLSAVTKAERKGDYKYGFEMLDLSLEHGIEKTNKEYMRFRRQLVNNLCVIYVEEKKFKEARDLLYSEFEYKVVPEANLLTLLKSVTTKEGNYLYNQKKYKDAIVITLDCLEKMPKDKILVNNLKIYYRDYIVYLKTANPKEVKEVLKEAKARFPNEEMFQTLVGDFEF